MNRSNIERRRKQKRGSIIHYRILKRYTEKELELPAISSVSEYLSLDKTTEWLEEVADFAERIEKLNWKDLGLEIKDALVQYRLEGIFSERHLIGEPDLIAVVNGIPSIIDLKVSPTIRTKDRFQLAGYYLLCVENGIEVDRGLLIYLHPNSRLPWVEMGIGQLNRASKAFLQSLLKLPSGSYRVSDVVQLNRFY
jgi:CRISPR/Cas system-associated exonuclease Cas4 (RecB family)